jgi:hypothetical protein
MICSSHRWERLNQDQARSSTLIHKGHEDGLPVSLKEKPWFVVGHKTTFRPSGR